MINAIINHIEKYLRNYTQKGSSYFIKCIVIFYKYHLTGTPSTNIEEYSKKKIENSSGLPKEIFDLGKSSKIKILKILTIKR